VFYKQSVDPALYPVTSECGTLQQASAQFQLIQQQFQQIFQQMVLQIVFPVDCSADGIAGKTSADRQLDFSSGRFYGLVLGVASR
jgi:hypothetical protein